MANPNTVFASLDKYSKGGVQIIDDNAKESAETFSLQIDSASAAGGSTVAVTGTPASATIVDEGDIVVFESTVYPGATEEVCIPLLEQHSGMKWKEGFHVGFSPPAMC